MFEKFKLNRKLKTLSKELEIKESQVNLRNYEYALKVIDKALETSNIVVDDEKGWFKHGDSEGHLSQEEHQTMLTNSYKFYHNNPHARAIVRGLVKFTLGKGPMLIPDAKNKKVKEIWDDFKRRNKFSKREKEIATRLFRDGEVFLRLFTDKSNGEIKIRFIRSSLIRNPIGKDIPNCTYGIKTNPDDIEEIVSYLKCDSAGNLVEEIPAANIIHLKIFSDSDEKRGISIYKVCVRRVVQYDEWLEDRVVLNKVRSAIALIRNVESSAPVIKNIRDDKRSTLSSSDTNKVQTPARGTIITASKGVKYEMLSPNINAADSKDDGRAMLLSIAAGVGMPEMIFTADYSNANYSSSLIAQNPWVREIEEWQDYFSDFYKELFEIIVNAGIEYGGLPEKTETTCRLEFPPMIAADIEKIAKAFEIIYKFKGVSKKTWQGKMGLDPDVEKIQIEEEGDDFSGPGIFNPGPGGGSLNPASHPQFNMPTAPVNQYGHEIIEALKNKDWERIVEIGEAIEKDLNSVDDTEEEIEE